MHIFRPFGFRILRPCRFAAPSRRRHRNSGSGGKCPKTAGKTEKPRQSEHKGDPSHQTAGSWVNCARGCTPPCASSPTNSPSTAPVLRSMVVFFTPTRLPKFKCGPPVLTDQGFFILAIPMLSTLARSLKRGHPPVVRQAPHERALQRLERMERPCRCDEFRLTTFVRL